ncbi:uncharacterized protein VP01_687g1 [Puccinia sorghi]|uniref:DUF4939 domain-containing protein n=1 Tax=Puccinia sorghi TaxID=27349 RepID=A0A0L6UEE1_9BASI|nr:uncharacterized protein VP01_687g1 [Puccinia sorghi]
MPVSYFSRLEATAGQQNPAPAQPNPTPAPASNPIVLAKPQPFNGTRSAAAQAFFGRIGLHAITYPEHFPTNTRKVVFAVLFMKDYAQNWSQPYLDKVFNRELGSLKNSSMILDPASLITTAGTFPRWPCRTSTRLEPSRPQGEHPTCRGDEQC